MNYVNFPILVLNDPLAFQSGYPPVTRRIKKHENQTLFNNSFIIESLNNKIAIDPGLNMWIGKMNSLIPESEWEGVTHIFVTHGNPDHYWYTDKVAEVASAPIICGKDLVKNQGGDTFILDPDSREIRYSTPAGKVYPLDVGDVLYLDSIMIEG